MTHGSNFNFNVLKVLREEGESPGQMALQIVRWERATCPVIEKRRIYVTKHGETRFRKLVGMTAADIQYIVDNAQEILTLLKEDEDVR